MLLIARAGSLREEGKGADYPGLPASEGPKNHEISSLVIAMTFKGHTKVIIRSHSFHLLWAPLRFSVPLIICSHGKVYRILT